jgi:hypothetical protein
MVAGLFATTVYLLLNKKKRIQIMSNNTIKEKINANRIFDLKYRVYGQKFSWIYMNSTSVDVYTGDAKNSGTLKNGLSKLHIAFKLNFIYMVSVVIA